MEINIIRVLLVDDHEVVRAGYRRLLENTQDIQVIAEAKSGEEAYSLYIAHQPNVVIMDLSMPGIGGIEAVSKILHREKSAKILVFSVHESETFLSRVLEAGALGYITKRSAAKVMVEAIRQVAQGNVFIGQEMQQHLTKQRNIPHRSLFEALSPREFEVFLLIAEGKSVNDVADLLNLSSKTVGHHYTSVKNKLNIANAAELTRLAIRAGLIEP
ncbi:MAG: DNA-binding response regulator [Beggiatoa sp. IS2]|nr:MAG: DNA-binding response regulator [Beggiatoa sp. IS2]